MPKWLIKFDSNKEVIVEVPNLGALFSLLENSYQDGLGINDIVSISRVNEVVELDPGIF